MNANVAIQRAGLSKLCPTCVTFIRFLPGMSSNVVRQCSFTRKLGTASFTCEWFLPSVNAGRVKLSILDPLSRKWHSTVIEHTVKMQILLIIRYGSRYICLASKLQELYYFSRKIITCKTNILSNLGHCLPILDLRDSYIGPHPFQTKTTLTIVVLN